MNTAKYYAGKTQRAIRNDLDKLLEMKLIRRTSEGYRANIGILAAFLPDRRIDEETGGQREKDVKRPG